MLLTPQARIETAVGFCQDRAIEAHKLLQVPELTPAPIPALYPCYCLLLILLLLNLLKLLNSFPAAIGAKADDWLLFE